MRSEAGPVPERHTWPLKKSLLFTTITQRLQGTPGNLVGIRAHEAVVSSAFASLV